MMGELILNEPMAGLVRKNRIDDQDVLKMRQTVFADGVVSRAEAEALFAVDRSCADKADSWTAFMVEAVSDYLVNVEAPRGWISEDNAAWLIRAISHDGKVDTVSELELLMVAMEKAQSMPASLSAFALRQIAMAVMEGEGPLASGHQLTKGRVTAEDVRMLRRVLYANSGHGSISVTRDEAEVLFDINDHTVEAANDPAWADLFARAIAFSLMTASGYQPPAREEALRREEWLADTSVNVGGFFGGIFAGGLRGYFEKMVQSSSVEKAYAARNTELAEANAVAEHIDHEEAEWLAARIGRDGQLHENEKALLRFIREESPSVHPSLQSLLDKVA